MKIFGNGSVFPHDPSDDHKPDSVGGGVVIYNYDTETEILTDESGSTVTVEQAIGNAFNICIYDGVTHFRPTSVMIGDEYVVFAVKPIFDDEYEVVVGRRPK